MTDGPGAGLPPEVQRQDEVVDRQTLLRTTGVVALGFGVGASVQSAWIYSQLVPEWAQVDLWRRLAVNGASVAALVAVLGATGTHRVRGAAVALRLLLAAALMAVLRVTLQVVLGVHDGGDVGTVVAETVTGLFVALIAAAVGAGGMASRRRARARVRAAERERVEVEIAARAFADAETRVRRSVAEGLHGTLQQRLVLVDGRLGAVAAAVEGLPGVAVDLAWAREQLAEARDADVRRMSRLLYPERIEAGLVPAVRALLRRLPAHVATALEVGDEVRGLDDPVAPRLTPAERLLVVRVVEEALTNALKHGGPGRVDVRLDVEAGALVAVVRNDGAPYVAPARTDPESGGSRLAQRLRPAGGALHVRRGEPTGTVVEAALPLGVLEGEAVR